MIKKNKKYLIIFFSALLILPFLIIAFYNNPIADDYCNCVNARDKNLFSYVSFFYNNWTGRYAQIIILYFINLFDIVKASKIVPVIFIILNVHALYFLIKSIIKDNVKNEYLFLVSCTVNFIFYSFMPFLAAGNYWVASISTYFSSWIVFLYYLALLFKFHSNSLSKIEKIFFPIIIVFLIGLNESVLIFSFVIMLITIALNFQFFYNSRYYKMLLLLFVAFSILSIMAPGNYLRMASETLSNPYNTDPSKKKSLFFSVFNSFSICIFYIKQYWYLFLFFASIIPLILFKYVGVDILAKMNFQNKKVLQSFLFFISIPIIAFPSYWATNDFQSRLGNLMFYFLLIFFIWFVICLCFRFYGKISTLKYILFGTCFFSIFAISYSLVIQNSNFKIVIHDILKGRAKDYDNEFKKRYNSFKVNENITVSDIKNVSPVLYMGDIKSDSAYWVNVCTANYFHLKSIKINNEK